MKKVLIILSLILLTGCGNKEFKSAYENMNIGKNIESYQLDLRIYGSVDNKRINKMYKIDNYKNQKYKIDTFDLTYYFIDGKMYEEKEIMEEIQYNETNENIFYDTNIILDGLNNITSKTEIENDIEGKELKVYEEKMEKSINAMMDEFASIRAGRANPHVLDKIKVDYYGTPTPIQQVGNISVPEARMIVIQPWEKSLIKAIEKAIQASDLGINPSNDGSVIRLVFPELTEDRRKELAKDVKKKGEAAKVAVRNIRRDANEAFKKQEKNNEISEDDLKDATEQIQKITDKAIEKIDKAVENKTKEILTV